MNYTKLPTRMIATAMAWQAPSIRFGCVTQIRMLIGIPEAEHNSQL